MRFLVVLPLIFLSSFSCIAQDSELFRACNEKAKRQADEMNVCANEEAVRTDTELNNLYRTLLSRCGALAKTPKARQCRFCRHDWHDIDTST